MHKLRTLLVGAFLLGFTAFVTDVFLIGDLMNMLCADDLIELVDQNNTDNSGKEELKLKKWSDDFLHLSMIYEHQLNSTPYKLVGLLKTISPHYLDIPTPPPELS